MNNYQKKNIIQKINQNQVIWDFSSINQNNTIIDCILIQNNIVLNLPWLKKSIQKTNNIVLADGGANIFYQSQLGNHQKIKAIVGDLDSLKPNVLQYYQNLGIIIEKIEDQDRNDFQKAIEWIANKGWKTVFAFGSFGGRMDHTLATMSNAQKLTKKYPQLELVLLGKTNIMCVLRGGLKHTIKISKDINRKGCGIISFNKVQRIETTGFRYNMGQNYKFQSLQWGKFISSSNQILQEQVTIESFNKNQNIKFVSTFNHQF